MLRRWLLLLTLLSSTLSALVASKSASAGCGDYLVPARSGIFDHSPYLPDAAFPVRQKRCEGPHCSQTPRLPHAPPIVVTPVSRLQGVLSAICDFDLQHNSWRRIPESRLLIPVLYGEPIFRPPRDV